MGGRVRAIVVGLAALGVLFTAPPALAATSVTCAGLQSAMDSATPGEVLQLQGPTCVTNIDEETNTNAFTLEGTSGGTTLTPAVASKPIIESTGGAVRFTLSGLTFSGTSGASAILLQGPGEAVTISDDTFTANVLPSGFGAAVSIQLTGPSTAATPTVITGSTFAGDQSSGGGAVAALDTPPLLISNNSFIGNSASTSGGGALTVGGGMGAATTVQITGNTFAGNTSQGPGGAAYVALAHQQSLVLTSNTFLVNKITGNSSDVNLVREGGAVYLTADKGDNSFTVAQSHNTFTGNVINETRSAPAPPVIGGGAEWIQGATVRSTADTFTSNRLALNDGAPPEGGAVGALATAASGSTAAQPGVFIGADDVFSGNSTAAGGWGGAIYVGGPPPSCTGTCPPSTLTLNDSTVIDNSIDGGKGSEGGAIWGSPGDHLTFENSIAFGNTPQPELLGFGFGSGRPVIAFSDVCYEPGGTRVPTAFVSGDICEDPELLPSGAETPWSPTIDAGANALVPAGLTTDLAGNPRVIASKRGCNGPPALLVDMGAYEFTGLTPPPPCPSPPTGPVHVVRVRITIGGGGLTLRRGAVRVRLSCQTGVSYCDGTLELRLLGKHRRGELGKAHFHIPKGRTALVTVELSGQLLGGAASVPVLAVATVHDLVGTRESARRGLTILAHRPRRRRASIAV